jgi:hypothetical protein
MKELNKMFVDKLKPLGFIGSQRTFLLRGNELIKVLNLQKSPYSSEYYINIGIFINSLGEPVDKLKAHNCHINFRAEAYYSQSKDKDGIEHKFYSTLHNIDKDTFSKLKSDLNDIIENYVINIFLENNTIDDLKKSYADNKFLNAIIKKEAAPLIIGKDWKPSVRDTPIVIQMPEE